MGGWVSDKRQNERAGQERMSGREPERREVLKKVKVKLKSVKSVNKEMCDGSHEETEKFKQKGDKIKKDVRDVRLATSLFALQFREGYSVILWPAAVCVCIV